MPINYGVLLGLSQQTPFWLLLHLHLPPHLMLKIDNILVNEIIPLLSNIIKPQDLQTAIFLNILVPQLKTPGHPAASRETPELMRAGGIKQPSVDTFLIYLCVALTNCDFLVDTGSSRSVFPHHLSATPTGHRLLMADDRPIKAWGSRVLPLQFVNHCFQFPFLLASVDQPTLGADYLVECDLLVLRFPNVLRLLHLQ